MGWDEKRTPEGSSKSYTWEEFEKYFGKSAGDEWSKAEPTEGGGGGGKGKGK
eukprot:CAMPEP_0204397604 /NCGR_PEP_ID=MMETSP0470-20130426/2257_1 /ASSEMBLY_ACC=CAM_ASM_000385 /TAXON_ID=2969 /ORGANISM="Oxyrrhis marina" /LENGTH=51 /DNA_ID=CAMNT_0051392067 /DNA_START=44 /DNA_END=196 /DNA_ORIENTATION=+